LVFGLIDKIGMNSMVIETGWQGTMWALLMDGQQQELVKIRLLYLHKGNWNGEQVLDESWVKY
jgi:predicted N-acyltransferase